MLLLTIYCVWHSLLMKKEEEAVLYFINKEYHTFLHNENVIIMFILYQWKVMVHNSGFPSLFQVTFVFSNQVDGKLVPIESTMSPKVQATEGNSDHLKQRRNPIQKTVLVSQQQLRKPLDSIPANQNSIRSNTFANSCKPLQRASVKGLRTSLKCSSVHESLKPKLSVGNQLPQKRLSPDTVEHDDDFA